MFSHKLNRYYKWDIKFWNVKTKFRIKVNYGNVLREKTTTKTNINKTQMRCVFININFPEHGLI